MPKATYITMYIDRALKTELRRLADEHSYGNLTEFICAELQDGLVSPRKRKKSPTRGPRGAYLTMWIDVHLKEQLLRLADADYRNLTDFVELQLQRAIAARKGDSAGLPIAAVQKPLGSRQAKKGPDRDRIAISINSELKSELKRLAGLELRTLTNFIEFSLHQVIAAMGKVRTSSMPRRKGRDARLTMRVTPALKARLAKGAEEEYRTLTDFVEIDLRRIAARYRTRARTQ